VTQWNASKSYQEIKSFVNLVKVINDAAERGIKLNSDCTALLTDDPVQRANLLQPVEDHKHKFPDFSKLPLPKHCRIFKLTTYSFFDV